jgi:hypothetical protein
VLGYPLGDAVAYALMAIVVGVAGTLAGVALYGAGAGFLISQGLLYAYAFTAINRVSSGNTKNFMPEISDISDLIRPVRLGVAAMIISQGPALVLFFVLGVSSVYALMDGSFGASEVEVSATAEVDSAEATAVPEDYRNLLREDGLTDEQITELYEAFGDEGFEYFLDEEGLTGPEILAQYGGFAETEGPPPTAAATTATGALIALPFALLWWLLYTPIALIAAAISQSFFATLNPVTGITAIRRMGSIYWEAWFVYTGITIVATIGVSFLQLIPLAGTFLSAFVQSYAFLCSGCLLGFAVFKRAEELGLA